MEVTNTKDGKSQVMCVQPFGDYLMLRKMKKGDQVVTKLCRILEVNGRSIESH